MLAGAFVLAVIIMVIGLLSVGYRSLAAGWNPAAARKLVSIGAGLVLLAWLVFNISFDA